MNDTVKILLDVNKQLFDEELVELEALEIAADPAAEPATGGAPPPAAAAG